MATNDTPRAKATKATPAPEAKATRRDCACGCGAKVQTAKATFLSGHDARLAGQVGRAIAAGEPDAAQRLKNLPSDKLRAKAQGVADTAARKAAEKVARAKAKQAADEAFKAAMANA